MINIGDVAHTPAMLALLERHFPEARVTLWPHKPLTPAARALMLTRFPALNVVEGDITNAGKPSRPELARTLDEADFLLHGSGPAMLDWAKAEAFSARTGRAFGVYGVTYGLYGIPEKATLSRARFVYFRDSISLAAAKKDVVNAPVVEWSPDVAFAADLRDDARAAAFLRANGLEDGQFLCCISRLRNTPFWEHDENSAFDPEKHARNESMKARDHAPLIEAIVAVTRQTATKVLICPEDASQMAVSRENILEKLPTDVRERVVWREDFWLPDEVLSVYRRSAGVFGHEMHSPIMAVGNGVPGLVCRWAEQSTKGLMWRDIGLGAWLFDFDNEEDLARLAPAVLALAQDPQRAKIKAAAAREVVFARFAETMEVVNREVYAARHS